MSKATITFGGRITRPSLISIANALASDHGYLVAIVDEAECDADPVDVHSFPGAPGDYALMMEQAAADGRRVMIIGEGVVDPHGTVELALREACATYIVYQPHAVEEDGYGDEVVSDAYIEVSGPASFVTGLVWCDNNWEPQMGFTRSDASCEESWLALREKAVNAFQIIEFQPPALEIMPE